MEELINIKVQNDQQLVSARELHKGLGLKKKFSDWVGQNFKEFVENQDFTSVPKGTVVQIGNGAHRYYDDYYLTLDMAKQLCLMSRTKKGKEYRKYLIEVEKKWNSPVEIIKRGYSLLLEQNQQLKIENKNLNTQLDEANKRATYLDIILNTKDAIAVTQIAADYGYSAVSFNKLLQEIGIQHRVHGQWILYKVYMSDGYTTPITHTYFDNHGEMHSRVATYWTQKGRKLIYDVLKEHKGILPLIEREDVQ
ncbi:phage antirepressor KilAC domain-containing protein [Lactobacillus sp. LL6]|uniref:phage antirepressor KilAC domain-containing protein n=1 Tax=Lactobacillus sp. LL6 TaxID=2596827 RepID=UPI0011865A58|nr:phage antirepressor KilAC domain-containing protein [Lactobacillus sp. LL6]TSO25317.1 phage antirepressor Ant [Lactobacillus sp. LL6]